jgi:sporulation protein YqfC
MQRLDQKIRRLTAKWLDLPKDIVMEMPRITITGPFEMLVENHGGVIRGSENLIQLAIPHGSLEIKGESLIILSILPEEVKIEGVIHSVKFL